MINYESLKSSLENLKNIFLEFYDHVILTQEMLLEKIQENKSIPEEFLKEIENMENKSNYYEAQILDESCWIISKDSPRANHLRFIIAILNSIKDLERMSDYIFHITKYMFYHKELNKNIQELIVCSFSKSTKLTKQFAELIKEKDNPEYYDNAISLKEQYCDFYNQQMIKLAKTLTAESTRNELNSFSGATIALKNIERNIDHAMNIIENFVFIKQSSFFQDKINKRRIKNNV